MLNRGGGRPSQKEIELRIFGEDEKEKIRCPPPPVFSTFLGRIDDPERLRDEYCAADWPYKLGKPDLLCQLGADVCGIIKLQMRIAVLMTCHNRCETTLRCLAALRDEWERLVGVGGRSGSGTWEWDNGWLDVFLVDDGSTDGTSAAVREWEKKWEKEAGAGAGVGVGAGQWKIHIIKGSGCDYWAKGMELAWRTAVESFKLRSDMILNDGFLWLNDDVVLKPGAIEKLLSAVPLTTPTVAVGELVNAKGEVTYGKRGDLFTGNFVYVPREVYEKVGMICGEFWHAWADSDYALRCKRAGVPVVSCGVVGTCEGHPLRPDLRGRDLRWRWRSLWDPKGWCVHDLWLYRRRNWGVLAAIWSCIHLILHVLVGEMKNE